MTGWDPLCVGKETIIQIRYICEISIHISHRTVLSLLQRITWSKSSSRTAVGFGLWPCRRRDRRGLWKAIGYWLSTGRNFSFNGGPCNIGFKVHGLRVLPPTRAKEVTTAGKDPQTNPWLLDGQKGKERLASERFLWCLGVIRWWWTSSWQLLTADWTDFAAGTARWCWMAHKTVSRAFFGHFSKNMHPKHPQLNYDSEIIQLTTDSRSLAIQALYLLAAWLFLYFLSRVLVKKTPLVSSSLVTKVMFRRLFAMLCCFAVWVFFSILVWASLLETLLCLLGPEKTTV